MASSEEPLPSREWCFALLKEWELPRNVLDHTMQVDRVAVFLARRLKAAGIDIDEDVVDRAALLHDLDKIRTLDSKDHKHGFLAKEALTKLGYPKMGELVRQHRFDAIKEPGLSWEAKVVNYADKRVTFDKIVTLKGRFDYLIKRYEVKNIDFEAQARFVDFEKEIFGMLRLEPDRLSEYIEKEDA